MSYKIADLKVKIFADGADKNSILALVKEPWLKGFTTNPTLMRKAGVSDYEQFAKEILSLVKDKPISFEVFADDFDEMAKQAKIISSWADNVYVKIPITNTKGASSSELVKQLSSAGIKINVTAIFTLEQVKHVLPSLVFGTPSIISVFAGRIADTGRDPVPLMKEAKQIISQFSSIELLWASPRELFNIFHAEEANCDIITVTPDVLSKLSKVGYDLTAYSLDTVKMFYDDAKKAGYKIVGNDCAIYINTYFDEVKKIADTIDKTAIRQIVEQLTVLRAQNGRLFILGIGGSAANASHAVNDFRKMCKIESYAPTDNVAELTAWTNDKNFGSIFKEWLKESKLNSNDALMIFSVGGGSETTSQNLGLAMEYAKEQGSKILGVVSRDGGLTKKSADVCVLVPVITSERITPHAEEWQGIIWHLIANALYLNG